MINVSLECRRLMQNNTGFLEYVTITLASGTVLTIPQKDLVIQNNGITSGSAANSFPIGQASARTIRLEIANFDDKYSEYDFYGAKIGLVVKYLLAKDPERTENFNYGFYTVISPETRGTTIKITAVDDMYKADRPYSTNLTFPKTALQVYTDACQTLGLAVQTATFTNDDFIVQTKPHDCTFRQVLGGCAMLAGGNIYINREGRVEIKTYNSTPIQQWLKYDGGVYSPWEIKDNLSGGTFNPWNTGDIADGDSFQNMLNGIHVLYAWLSPPAVDTDDITITGVRTELGSDESVLEGEEGYVLTVENPLIEGKEADALELIGDEIIGLKFRQFSGEYIGDPTIEFMDPCIVTDRKGNTYGSFVTDTDYSFRGKTSISNSAEPKIRTGISYAPNDTKTMQKARSLVETRLTGYDLGIMMLTQLMSQSIGMYTTRETDANGATVFYTHDKPTLAESTIIRKITANGITQSVDGGTTWTSGIDASGNAVLNTLAAIGINADWINAGSITIQDTNGNETLYANTQTGEVRINASTVKIGGTEFNQKVQQIIEANDFDTDNLLIDSTGFSSDYWETSGTVDTGQTDPYGGTDAIKITPTSGTQGYIRAKSSNNNPFKTTGVWYRLSVWLKASSSSSNPITLYLNNEAYSVTPTTAWKQYWFDKEVSTVSSSNNLASIGGESSFTASDGYSLYVYNPRVFYTQKPETMREMFNRLTGNSKNQGLYIDTDSQGVDRAFVNLTYAQTGELKVYDENTGVETLYVNAKTGAVRINASSASVSGTSIANIAQNAADGAYADAKNYVDGKGYQTAANVQDYVNAKMSGLDTNLLKDSLGLSSTYWRYSGTLTRNQSDPNGGTNAVYLQPPSGGEGYLQAMPSTNNPFKSTGTRYKLTVWLKATTNADILSDNGMRLYLNGVASSEIYPTTSWKKYELSGIVNTPLSPNDLVTIGGFASFTSSDGYGLYIYNPVVEYTFTYEEVYKALTNDGRNDGWWIVDNHLYMNLTYLQSGILKLGGNVNGINNGNGELHVYDGNNKKCATFDTDGITLLGTSSGYTYNKTLFKEGFIAFYYNNVRKGYIVQSTSGLEIHGTVKNSNNAVQICAIEEDSSGHEIQSTVAMFGSKGINFQKRIVGGATFDYVEIKDRVNGFSLIADYAINAAGGIQTTSVYYSGSLVPTSDKRLKKNIRPIDVDIIEQLNVVQFDWIETDKHVSAGLIAQEVETVLPELVEDRPDGYKGLKYLDLVPHLIYKVQQQQKQINDLETRLARLEAIINGNSKSVL